MASPRADGPGGAALRDWLGYLSEIGYRDLFLGGSAPAPGAVAERPARASRAAAARPAEPSPGPEERLARLAALAAEAAGCRACRLCEKRNKVVFGSGDGAARLMFIGEGPGAQEDRQGLPFVGPAGELLTKIIAAIGLSREQVYIANVVKCRPPENRDPMPDEIAACRGFLEQQIDLVAPRVLVLLGRVAAQSMLGNDTPIGRMRGRWYSLRGVPTMVTYHPAALLRAPELKRPTWEDMQQVRDRLADGP